MRPTLFNPDTLAQALQRRTVATLSELSNEVGPCSHRTVQRKLKQLDYRSSYSHRGKYYTLCACANFDSHGLWSYNGIRFSRYGTLQNTAKELVESSPVGYRSDELDDVLKVHTTGALLNLVRAQKLSRISLEGQSIYCSADPARQQRQIAVRRIQRAGMTVPASMETDSSKAAAILLFFSLLNEKQRRLFAGLTSLLWGYGGDKRVANLLGLNRKTVRRGRRELHADKVDPNRVRKPGGGRPSLQKKPLDDRTATPIGAVGDGWRSYGRSVVDPPFAIKVIRSLEGVWNQGLSNDRGEVAPRS